MKKIRLTSLACVSLLLVSTATPLPASAETQPAAPADTLLTIDFDHNTDDAPTQKLLNHELIHLAEGEGPDGGDAILVDYVGFPRGSKRMVAWFPLERSVETATLSFDVRFAEGFRWMIVGKMHGLGPETPITGGKERHPDGWSARMMFREDGLVCTYYYDQAPGNRYGNGDNSEGPVFVPGQWHHIDYQVHINTPGEPDGTARIWVDGKEVVNSEEIVFRGVGGDTGISKFMFSTFHGGATPEYAPVDDEGNFTVEHAWYDNFVVREGEYVEQTPSAE